MEMCFDEHWHIYVKWQDANTDDSDVYCIWFGRMAIFGALYADKRTYPLWGLAALTLGKPSALVIRTRDGQNS